MCHLIWKNAGLGKKESRYDLRQPSVFTLPFPRTNIMFESPIYASCEPFNDLSKNIKNSHSLRISNGYLVIIYLPRHAPVGHFSSLIKNYKLTRPYMHSRDFHLPLIRIYSFVFDILLLFAVMAVVYYLYACFIPVSEVLLDL